MRVVVINYEYPPLGGGAANATKYILRKLRDYKDLKIDFITTSARNKKEIIKVDENLTIYKVNVNKKYIHHWKDIEVLKFIYKALRLTKKLNKKYNYDLAHAFFTIPAGYIPYKLKIPYIISIRGSDVPGFNLRFKFHYKIIKQIIKKIWKKSKLVVSNSEGLKNLALKTSPNQNIKIIPNGVDVKEFKPKDKKNKDLKILCVARLIKRKGLNYLISAIAELKEYKISLKIIGSGVEKNNLLNQIKELKIKDKVSLIDYIKHDDLPKYYSNSDIFVLPSLNEGMSNTILEAIASGLPIITTNTGGSKELIKGNGIIIKKRNKKDIREAILKLYKDKKLRVKMSKKSRNLALKLDWKKVAEEYYNYYKKCVE